MSPVRLVDVFIPFRWVREGLFRFTFELHRSSRSAPARSSDAQRFIYQLEEEGAF